MYTFMFAQRIECAVGLQMYDYVCLVLPFEMPDEIVDRYVRFLEFRIK